jgi:hypothetical protein
MTTNPNLTSLHVNVDGKPSKRTLRLWGQTKSGETIFGVTVQDVVRPCVTIGKNVVKIHSNASLAKPIDECPAAKLSDLGIDKSAKPSKKAEPKPTKVTTPTKTAKTAKPSKVTSLSDLPKLGLKTQDDSKAAMQALLNLLVQAIKANS